MSGDSCMELISYKDDAGNTYWLVHDPDTKDEAAERELCEISEKGWDAEVRAEDVDMEELISLKYFLDQFLSE